MQQTIEQALQHLKLVLDQHILVEAQTNVLDQHILVEAQTKLGQHTLIPSRLRACSWQNIQKLMLPIYQKHFNEEKL